MIAPVLSRPWLWLDLGRPHVVLSWAPANPWLTQSRMIAWREVRDADLSLDFDAEAWLRDELRSAKQPDAVTMLTSRNLGCFRLETACSGRASATCLATIGLSNAERVGSRQQVAQVGTINMAVVVSAGLTQPAMLEAITIATEARTAAVMDYGPDLPDGRATGTGTDCIALAVPAGGDIRHAGLHTEIGEAVGRAVYDAVSAGVRDWMASPGGRDE